jgi:hypothetical protein
MHMERALERNRSAIVGDLAVLGEPERSAG